MEAVRWVPAPIPPAADDLARDGLPAALAALLARRGVTGAEAARAFLEPSLGDLHDPFALAGMARAVERLAAARERGERVAVVGDYDVDGVTGTALLLAVLRHCGYAAEAILPHRLREGYGFQPRHVERAREQGCALVVTVDCGTTSGAAARAALAAGIDVIVTDHHLPGSDLPAEVVQINPHQEGCAYPFPDLSGAGLALKLAQAVARAAGRRPSLEALLRVACLGTIADLVPLRGENRVIAALGLAALPATSSPGLLALLAHAGVKAPLSASDVGYRLGPRINAAGRLDDAGKALDLLLTRDPAEAADLAAALEHWNRERQSEEQRVVREARDLVTGRGPLPPILMAWDAGWHRGVVGIAAGRLAREFFRPTVLLAVEGEEAVGSGRSIPAIELHGFLRHWHGDLLRFGGHAQAIGLSVASHRLEPLRRSWEESAAAWPAETFVRTLEYELDLEPCEVGAELLAQLSRLEPHGQGNPRPLLKVGPLRLAGPPRVFGRTERRHLSGLAAGPDGARVPFVAWGWAERADALAGDFEALGHLELDRYSGRPVLRLVDSRAAGPSGSG